MKVERILSQKSQSTVEHRSRKHTYYFCLCMKQIHHIAQTYEPTTPNKKKSGDAVRAEKYLNHRWGWLYRLPRCHSIGEKVPALQGSLCEFIAVDRFVVRKMQKACSFYFYFLIFCGRQRSSALFDALTDR